MEYQGWQVIDSLVMQWHHLYRWDSFPHHSFALRMKQQVPLTQWYLSIGLHCATLWKTIIFTHLLCNKFFSTPFGIFLFRNVHYLWIILQPSFSVFLCFPQPVFLVYFYVFPSFQVTPSIPVVLIVMFTFLIVLCLKSLCICLRYVWKCVICVVFYHYDFILSV